jgi:exosortase
MVETNPPSRPLVARLSSRALLLVGLLAVCLWAYVPLFRTLADRWAHDPQYSHGWLVPAFALFLLWRRWQDNPTSDLEEARGAPWGLLLVAFAVALRLAGARYYVGWLESFSLLPCLAGAAVLLGGWPALGRSWPAIAFLLFMAPLPFRVEGALAAPLQRIATVGSTWALEILGLRASAEGNIIQVADEVRLGVVEACGGLSMLISFLALSAAVAIAARRPLLDRLIVLASAIPIALLANIVRITVTACLHVEVGAEASRWFFHDAAGWFMLVFAMALMGLELALLSRILVPVENHLSGVPG